MSKEKFYFKTKDSECCYLLEDIIFLADKDVDSEITVFEAVPYNDLKHIFWCTNSLYTVDRCDCKKSECDSYSPLNGKNGPCCYRGKLFSKGKEVRVNLQTGAII